MAAKVLPGVDELCWALAASARIHDSFPVGPFVLMVPLAFVVLLQLLVLGYIIEKDRRHDGFLL